MKKEERFCSDAGPFFFSFLFREVSLQELLGALFFRVIEDLIRGTLF